MKKIFKIMTFVFLLIFFFCLNPLTMIHAENKQVIRVGYPMIGNVSQKDDEGNYYGYDYEFLKQIAQYTGWEYEFVEVEGDLNTRLMTLLTMLQNGEIDLLGSMTYSDSLANVYDYASEPYGYSYETLIVKNDSDIYDQNALISKKNILIGVHQKATSKLEKLNQFSKMNNFTYKEVKCTDDNMYALLDEDKADAVLTTDMTIPEGYRVVAKFFPDPFYFATTKGNSELISELNQALMNIEKLNPTFKSTLYNRYFTGDNQNFLLNSSEKEYIKNHQIIKVLVRNGQAPVQYSDSSIVRGVAKDILDIVAEKTGIRFEYTVAKNYDDYVKLNETGDYDVLIGLPYEMTVADTFHVSLSNPFVSGNLTLVTNHSVDPNHLENYIEGKTPYTFKNYNASQRVKSQSYEFPEDILKAIDRGEVHYTYLNSYIATYYISKNNLSHISTFTVTDYLKSQYSYGVKKDDDLTLLGILNKAINSVEADMNSMIYKNASIEKEFSMLALIEDNIIYVVLGGFLIAACVIYIIYRHYKGQLTMKHAVELEYRRYQMLYDITGEMTFSYNYVSDIFKISRSGLGKIAVVQTIDDFSKREFSEKEKEQILYNIYQFLMKQQDVNCESEFTLVNDEKNWCQIIIKLVTDLEGKHQQAVYAVGKVFNIQKDIMEKEQLKQKSIMDSLTGIYNRAGAREIIMKKLLDKDKRGAFVMLDIDNFKEVNDCYGHLDGDRVLQEMANLLTSVFENCVVARLGGDEFVIYVEETSPQEMKELCHQALKGMEELPYAKEKDICMTMSMGVVFTDDARDFSTLMNYADEKMYEVKREGKNSFHIFGNE